MTTREQLTEIAALTAAARARHGVKRPAPVVGAPATAAALAALEARAATQGLALPPSYRAALAAGDGISDFDTDVDLLPADRVLRPVDEALASDFPTLSRFVIGAGRGSRFLAFDPTVAAADGELAVVWVMEDGSEYRHASFAELLRQLAAQLRETVKATDAAPRKRRK